jgi:hypothetical protein
LTQNEILTSLRLSIASIATHDHYRKYYAIAATVCSQIPELLTLYTFSVRDGQDGFLTKVSGLDGVRRLYLDVLESTLNLFFDFAPGAENGAKPVPSTPLLLLTPEV